MRKIVIINTSNLQKGGALQVAKSFIYETKNHPNYDFHIILGKATKNIFNEMTLFGNTNNFFYTLNVSPTDSIFNLFYYKILLRKLELKIRPNFVISVFGPCYWRPSSTHIIGFANGYYLYEDSPFFLFFNFNKSFLYRLKRRFQLMQLKYEADIFWLETNDAKLRFTSIMKIDSKKSIVASNTASFYFSNKLFYKYIQLPNKKKVRLLYVSSYYVHKNFEIIPEVYKILLERGYDTEFLLTINKLDYEKNHLLKNCKGIHNIGNVDPEFCPYLYNNSDIIFVPSLLETFTAIYPEAMISQKPIVTTNLDFAKSICGNAALFYKYDDPNDAANKIIYLIEDKSLINDLVSKGLDRLKTFDSGETRFAKILNKIETCTF